ncbi:MAG: TetR/AcrR family transcriptional regulator [Pseudomonadota bacterium]
MIQNKDAKTVGRKKAFDPIVALDAAMETFWAKGFDGTSIDDLTTAMGINRPSLYATYGCKKTLFDKALQRYGETLGGEPLRLMEETDDIHEGVRTFLATALKMQTRDDGPKGCFSVACGHVQGEPNACLQERLAEAGKQTHARISARLRRAVDDGQLRKDFDCDARAAILMDFMTAQAVRARGGETRCDLASVQEERAALVLS